MRLDVYFHFTAPDLSEVMARLNSIQSLIVGLTAKVTPMSAQLDRLTAEVAEMGTVVDSAVTLIGGLAQQIRDLQDDPAALSALADSLDAKAGELGAAVAANTPAP